MSCGLFDQSSKAFSSVIRYENLRDILRERLKLSYITPINIALVNQISAFLKPVTKLFDKLEGVLTFFQLVCWVQVQGSFGSYGSRVNKSDPVSSVVGKFYKNHPKSFKQCSISYKMLQNFPVFQPGLTRCTNFHLRGRNILHRN